MTVTDSSLNSIRPAADHTSKQWFPGLDGVRALAFLAVFFVHQKPPAFLPQLNGGYAGVDLFFVLSGFLITTLLLQEFARTGRIDVRSFYLRRLVRLTPALLAFCAAVFALTFVDSEMKPAATSIRLHALGALTYLYNWIAMHTTSTGDNPRYFGALWSLSVEEQFYAIWPLVMLFVLRRSTKRRGEDAGESTSSGGVSRFDPSLLLRLLLIGIVVSNLLRVGLGINGESNDYNRAMWGTDVNASALFIGALGALVRLHMPEAMKRLRSALPLLVPIAAVGLAGLLFRLPSAPSKAPFFGGLLAFHVLSIVVILGVVERSFPALNRVFELAPLRWIGRVSYCAYIVHYFLVLRFGTNGGMRAPWITNLVITLVISGLSFRYFEQPLARHFRARWKLDPSASGVQKPTTHGQDFRSAQ